jgi:RNA polymerase sigma-70 factor (sigma-E family)
VSDRDNEFVEFVESMGPRLRRTAYLICGDWHRAEDAVQEAFYKLYLSWAKVDRSGNPAAYARRVVVNATLDGGRRSWRREVPTEVLPDESGAGDPAGAHAARDELGAGLVGVPPRQRACLVLRYYEDLSIEQAAEILGCSAGTVKSQTARGLETLRHNLDQSRSADRVSQGE